MKEDVRSSPHRPWQRQRARSAVDVDAIRGLDAVAPVRFVFRREASLETVVGLNPITGDEPYSSPSGIEVGGLAGAAVLGQMSVTPQRGTKELPQEIEEVGIQVKEHRIASVLAPLP